MLECIGSRRSSCSRSSSRRPPTAVAKSRCTEQGTPWRHCSCQHHAPWRKSCYSCTSRGIIRVCHHSRRRAFARLGATVIPPAAQVAGSTSGPTAPGGGPNYGPVPDAPGAARRTAETPRNRGQGTGKGAAPANAGLHSQWIRTDGTHPWGPEAAHQQVYPSPASVQAWQHPSLVSAMTVPESLHSL